MVTCTECQKVNALDSLFCRACGHALPEDLIEKARQENEALVQEGFTFLKDSRFEEALLVGEKTTAIDPTSVNAITLVADAKERLGDLVGAVEAYEKVVELTPDRALERIKLEHVKRILAREAVADVAPAVEKKRALIPAIASTVLVACIGSLLAISMNRSVPTQEKSEPMLPESAGSQSSRPLARPVSQEEAAALAAQSQGNRQPSSVSPNQTNSGQNGTLPNPEDRPSSPSNQNRPNEMEGEVSPMRVSVPGNLTLGPTNSQPGPERVTATQPERPPQRNPNQDPDPDASASGPKPETAKRPDRGPGEVNIRVSDNSPRTNGGSATIPDRTSSDKESVLKSARNFFLAGEFAKAAEAYSRALALGADGGINRQRLAQCYERLGRKSDAISAYQQAIQVYEARLRSNPSDNATQRALEACKSALSSLQ
jgi:tetratricopeptide (TPR) repeat protein